MPGVRQRIPPKIISEKCLDTAIKLLGKNKAAVVDKLSDGLLRN